MRASVDDLERERPVGAADAEGYVARTCFKTGPPRQVGVELEWLVHDAADASAHVPSSRLDGVVSSTGSLLHRGVLTLEPGGQLEFSSAPGVSLADCLAATAADLRVLRAAVADAGLRLTGVGLDPARDPRRVIRSPRYAAMERHLDRFGPDGRVMMCSTAAVQVCVEAGNGSAGSGDAATRWAALQGLGPVLVAAFANSPLLRGRPTGWRSTRQAVWWCVDPSRTRPPTTNGDPPADWARYALDASVLVVRRRSGPWDAPAGLTFRQWIDGAGPRPATYDDLDYHLSTLFPPVRPRGFLELRMVDAQPRDRWRVVAAVVAALLDDPVALDVVREATAPVRGRWLVAARDGLTDPAMARAARACFAAAPAALRRLGTPEEVCREVEEYTGRYVDSRRCPADDVLDAWSRGRVLRGPSGRPTTGREETDTW